MLMFGMLHHLLLAGTCFGVYGTAVLLPDFTPTQDNDCDRQCASSLRSAGSSHTTDVKSVPSDAERVTGMILNVDVGGVAGPHGRPEGIDPMTHAENGDSLDGKSGPSAAGGETWSQRREIKKVGSTSEMGEAEGQSEAASVLSVGSVTTKVYKPVMDEQKSTVTGGRKKLDIDMNIPKLTPGGFSASFTAPLLLSITARESKDPGGEDRTRLPGDSHQSKDPRTSLTSSTEPQHPSAQIQSLTSQSPITSSVFVSSRTSTPLTIWGHDGAAIPSIPDPLLPEIGPNLMPREDGPESLWTEAARPGGDTEVPLSQEEATEGTMSSEALPLIFEDAASEGAAAAAVVTLMTGSAQTPAAMVTRGMPLSEVDLHQPVTLETDSDSLSHAPTLLVPDWTSPWQTELSEPISSSSLSVSQRRAGTELEEHPEGAEGVAVRTPNLEERQPTTGSSLSSSQQARRTVTMETHQPVHKIRSGFEGMSEEEPEEDENSEESLEDESDEDLTETPTTSSTQPPYSLIPPPPVWVQHNQGLMRSWVELIREKVGYVSGMLAPVGIGIMGALLIVGALYSIRMIHHKRRNSFKHQRRKVRQPEQPREPNTGHQDQTMLLADSSEDEF